MTIGGGIAVRASLTFSIYAGHDFPPPPQVVVEALQSPSRGHLDRCLPIRFSPVADILVERARQLPHSLSDD